MKERLKLIIKVAGSFIALYLLYTQIDFNTSLKYLASSNPLFVIAALIAFNASQVLSSFRLNKFFQSIGIHITEIFNLKLYYIGMFYNLLLPGGVGGDGYKAYLLKTRFGVPLSGLIKAMIADRLNGLMAIYMLIVAMSYVLIPSLPEVPSWIFWMAILSIPVGIFIYVKIFPRFRKVLPVTLPLSLGVQIIQMGSVLALLYGLQIDSNIIAYLSIFLASSVATIIPVTIGGLGLRELVFLYGAQFFGLDQEISVAVSLLFFLLTAISSLIGLLFQHTMEDRHWEEQGSGLP